MNTFRTLQLATEEVDALRGRLLALPAVTPIRSEPKLAALVAALGIQQEIGTLNDELARFLNDSETGLTVARECLRSELIEYRGFTGVRIWAEGHERLELRLKGLRELLHPTFSFNADGTVRQCVFFPESLAKIAGLQGAELVLVREWALNTIFGGFDRSKLFYETNAWELVHYDSLRYAGLLAKRQIACLGTHDLTAHLAGLAAPALLELKRLGEETRHRFERYFGLMRTPSVYSLVLPYAAGVLLDDLAQPRNYGSVGRRLVFETVMDALDRRLIDPTESRRLARFPAAYEKLILLARDPDTDRVRAEVHAHCQRLIQELRELSFESGTAIVKKRSLQVG